MGLYEPWWPLVFLKSTRPGNKWDPAYLPNHPFATCVRRHDTGEVSIMNGLRTVVVLPSDADDLTIRAALLTLAYGRSYPGGNDEPRRA